MVFFVTKALFLWLPPSVLTDTLPKGDFTIRSFTENTYAAFRLLRQWLLRRIYTVLSLICIYIQNWLFFKEVLKLLHKGLNILKLPVHGCKAHVCHGILVSELPHYHFPKLHGGNLGF